ncbi:proline racemase family protein [Acidipila sp. EB88]|uniref:proline racemase family protein n=1 Tax=Acidipila sp. EB88 TaxID=2305226 RepID=UPI000F5E4BC2|nr:proline racemase family protein [Acidipila sp. EB88]RRA49362.1 hydroxyproline-2-epimerase [Acidipila sp. EB88]
MSFSRSVRIIDSHTAGEPTRVVLSGGPEIGAGSLQERLARLRMQDTFRSGVICEPRGSDVLVGALLTKPVEPDSSAAVIFFNDAGYLGMCGHGTIGLVTTLAHLGSIAPGRHRIETPVGIVEACLMDDGNVSVSNVPSYRYRAQVPVHVPGLGRITGDIAWGGNWFFLVAEHPYSLAGTNTAELLRVSMAIRTALRQQGITGPAGEDVDHIELIGAPEMAHADSRNFVLCPGSAFDRSPCGTGTSAKMACLFADGKLAPGQLWRQEGILGTLFEGHVEPGPMIEDQPSVIPTIQGRAWITADSTLLFDESDPFTAGFHF